MRQQLEAREQALKASEEAPDMTQPQAADYKRQLAALMQPGESVTEALRRLRPPPAKGPKRGDCPGTCMVLHATKMGRSMRGQLSWQAQQPGCYCSMFPTGNKRVMVHTKRN